MQNEQLRKEMENAMNQGLGDKVNQLDSKEKENLLNTFSDEEFLEELFCLEKAADVQKALKEKGFELTLEEVDKLKDTIMGRFEGGELSDDEMEQASGGFVIVATSVITGSELVVMLAAGAAGSWVGAKIYNKCKDKVKKWKW